MNMDKVQELRFWCNKVIPLVYDDALSYYETLCKVTDKLNEVIITLNNYSDELKAYVDLNIAEVRAEHLADVIKLNDKIDQTKADLQLEFDTKISIVYDKINANYTTLDNKINSNDIAVRKYIDELIRDLNARMTLYVNKLVNELWNFVATSNAYIEIFVLTEIEKLRQEIGKLCDMQVINPINQKTESINKVLNDLYLLSKIDSLTALQFDSMKLTAQEYDYKQITAFDYDNHAKTIFYARLVTNYMFNPFNGQYTEVRNVIYDLANLHRCGINALNYDRLEIEAYEYDSMNIEAWDYDWNGDTLFIDDSFRNAPTAQQFEDFELNCIMYELYGLTAFDYDFNGYIILSGLHNNTITASAFDLLLLTAKMYDDKKITAYNYDYRSAPLF